LGFAQNPIIIIETARELQNYKNIIFFIVGEGGMKTEMEQLADKYKLNNVIFVGEQPRKEIPYYINTFSCCLIPYKNTSLFTRTIPSKLFDYLAAGKPVIINLEGYASQIITTANAGLVAQPDNSIDLAKQILYLHNNIEIAKQMGINGRKYVEQYYDREKLLKELELFLINIVQK
jgi:glycosyltransferase involved in cell wall biosynthesis